MNRQEYLKEKGVDLELALNWITELEGGNYKQGHRYLRRKNDHYCCLGVLANVVNPDLWNKLTISYQWNDMISTLHYKTANKLGLSEQGTMLYPIKEGYWTINDQSYHALTAANDMGVSFKDIASALRKYYGFEEAQ